MNAPRQFVLPPVAGESPTVVHLAAEYYPYARTGGLAEAAWGLHRDQHRSGLRTMAIVPLYRAARQHIRHLEPAGDPFTLRFGPRAETFRLWRELDPASETPTCFLEHDGFFGRDGLYGERGADYPDNYLRFAAFAAASVAALPLVTGGPVLLHAHDWHAALAPVYLRTWWKGNPWFDRIPVVLSVHNGGYQGHFGPEHHARHRAAVGRLHARQARVVRQDQLSQGRADAHRHGDHRESHPCRGTAHTGRRLRPAGGVRVDGQPVHRRAQRHRPERLGPGDRPADRRPLFGRPTSMASAPARPTCSAGSACRRIRSCPWSRSSGAWRRRRGSTSS